MQAMGLDQSNEPRFKVLIWERGRHLTTHTAGDASRARRLFEAAVRRYQGSPINHRVELYDGPDLVDQWPSQEG
jgi:hypothetical protein